MRTVIIEDELPQANQLKALLAEIDNPPEVLAILQSVGESADFLATHAVDLIFLDIHLADGLGFEIFDKVPVKVPVIFTTAYDQYAMEAFRHNGIDYLLKPVSLQELKKAIEKFRSFTDQAPDYRQMLDSIRAAASDIKSYRNRFISRFGKKLKIVTTQDIAYFYVLGGGVFIRTIRNENLLVDLKMESLEQELDPYEFFRLNRQVIARISAIKEMIPYSKSRIKVILNPPHDEDVIISYQHVKGFMEWVRK
jgi:DNA-binding LytR/AlgR family response regulator